MAPDHDGITLEAGPGVIEFDVSEPAIRPSECRLSAGIRHIDQPPGGYTMDWWQDFATLQVHPGREVRGTSTCRIAGRRIVLRSAAQIDAGGVSPHAAG